MKIYNSSGYLKSSSQLGRKKEVHRDQEQKQDINPAAQSCKSADNGHNSQQVCTAQGCIGVSKNMEEETKIGLCQSYLVYIFLTLPFQQIGP